ncbi:MAG: DUF4349 domain-containing protein [Candidatus Taylorbacteria bacterium]
MQNFIQKIKENKFATVVTILLIIIVAFIFLVIIGNTYSNSLGTYQSGSMARYPNSNVDFYSKSYSPTSIAPIGSSASQAQIAVAEKKIVKEGSLSILVNKVDDTSNSIKTVAQSVGGSLDSINIYNVTNTTKSGSMVIRVPNDKFDEVMNNIRKLAVKVNNEQVNTTDVTARYVDMEANLTNYRAVEKQYISILQSAKNVTDTLAVYEKLSEVRGMIETTQGQINYLSRQVSMSTISIDMTSEADVTVFGIVWRPLTVLKQSFRSFLVDMTAISDGIVIWAFVLPGILIRLAILALVIMVVMKIYKFLRNKYKARIQKI